MRAFLILILLLFSSFEIPDLIRKPIPRPFIEQPVKSDRTEKINALEAKKLLSAEDRYELALNYILAGDLEKAKEELQEALKLKPDFPEAKIQMGFVFLWEENPDDAFPYFSDALKANPCEKIALYGMEKIAHLQPERAIAIYQTILACDPNNSDAYYYLGRSLVRKNDADAEAMLKEALRLAPENTDAAIELANLYSRQKNWEELEELIQKYPELPPLKLIYARSLAARQKYRKAGKAYDKMPKSQPLYRETFENKSHTTPSIFIETSYTDAKENDPTLRVPVVKDYYFYSALHVLVPFLDKWKMDVHSIYYHQRENDIYPPTGVNYSVYLGGAELSLKYDFTPDWRWNVYARAFSGWGSGQMNFPFMKTARFEPGTSLIHTGEHFVLLDAHVESFIIKNFAIGRSQLLRTDYYNGGYGYHPDVFLNPKVDVWAGWVYYHDSFKNWENIQIGKAEIDLYVPWLTLNYAFKHSHFNHLTQNYFSYRQQLKNFLGIRLHKELFSRVYFQALWEHTWQLTYNLIMPIGNFIFIAKRQYLISNLIDASLAYRYNDKLRLEIGGAYYYQTLPYRDWNLRGSLLWQF